MSSIQSIHDIPKKSTNKNKYLWSEWNDNEYNSIRFDVFHKDKPVAEKYLYIDPENVVLPDSLQTKVTTWIRSYEFFKDASEIVLFQECDTYKFPNLYELNLHLMCSPLMRLILSSFGIAQYYGDRYTNKMPKFFQSESSEPWRPWFHLYSFGKIKKDAPMDSIWNANGTCVARLFYGGSWVLIRMDDYIPIDKHGNALLPLVSPADKESNIVVLWPLFLTKALLKIAALTWNGSDEVVDFSPLHCFTGWVYEKIDVRGIDKKLVWDLCRPYADKYTWPEDDKVESGSKKRSRPKSASKPNTATKPNTAVTTTPVEKQIFLCILIKDMNFSDYGIPQLGPCFGHLCYVEQTRDCVLEKPEKMPELEPWKKLRWVEWARDRKIYPPDPYAESTFALELLSTFRRSQTKDADVIEEAKPLPPQTATTPTGSKKSSKKSKAVGPPPIPSPLLWCSFDHIAHHIFELHIFFIPGTFENNWIVTLKSKEKKVKPRSAANSLVSGKIDDKSRKSAVSANSNITEEEKLDTLHWPNELLISKNSPIYLLIDSLSTKFLLLSLQHKSIKYSRQQVLEGGSTTLRKNHGYRSKASIIIEKYTFESNEFGELEFFMSTMGITSKSITIPQGRYAYRIWLKSETPCNCLFISNTFFHLGKTISILEMMTKIPYRLQEFANSFSNSFSTFFNSIGYEDFKSCMRAFYQLIYPNLKQCTKKMKTMLNQTILEILFDMCPLCENPKNARYALSVLLGPRLSTSLIEEYSIENSAARKIQGMFRGFYVRRVLAKRFLDVKEYDIIQNSLREYYDTFLSVEQRNWTVPKIFLALLKRTNIYDYNFYMDYTYYLTTYTHHSQQRSKVEANSWAPLVMCKIFVPKSIFLRITVQTELSTQIVRVFDNDTGEEMPRFLDIVKPQIFNANELGYTIVAYGWNLENTDLWDSAWILQIAHLITEDLKLNLLQCDFKDCHKSQLEGIYVPNTANIVCGCFIRIKSDSTVVIRVGTTYELARIRVKLMTESGTILNELSGKHGIVFPPISLRAIQKPKPSSRSLSPYNTKSISSSFSSSMESAQVLNKVDSLDTFEPYREIRDRLQTTSPERTKTKETRYYLKVEVLDDSWPCTPMEWNAIQDYKHSKEMRNSSDGFTGSARSTTSKKSAPNKIAPMWTINVMSFEPLTLQQDTEKDSRILQLKQNWESANPGRFVLANKLRHQVLQDSGRISKLSDEDEQLQKKLAVLQNRSSILKAPLKGITPIKLLEDRTLIPKWKTSDWRLLHWKAYTSTSGTYNFIKGLLLERNKHIITTDKYWIKTVEDEKDRHLFREYRVQDFTKRHRMLNNFMEYVLDDYSKRFGSVYDHLEENMLTSEELTTEVYEARKYFCELERPRTMSFSWGV